MRLKAVMGKARSLRCLTVFRGFSLSISVILLSACASQALHSEQGVAEEGPSEAGISASSQQNAGKGDGGSHEDVADVAKRKRLRKWVEQQNRLYAVTAPLVLKNTSVCKKKTRTVSGIVTWTKYSYSKDFVAAAEQELGLSDRLQVMNVMSGSGADKSGIRRGDELRAIESYAVPSGPNAEQEAAGLMASAMRGKSSVRLTLARDGSEYVANVPLTNVCAVDVELGNADYVNAYSDGKHSLITAGMLDYAQSDTELAIVVAKEIAHNLVMQAPRQHMLTVIDSLRSFGMSTNSSPISTKIRPYTAVRDATADKYSIYLLTRAGYDIDKVLPFWKRLASRFPATQLNSHTALHPSTAYRFSVITAVTSVVKHTKKHGWPLIPQ